MGDPGIDESPNAVLRFFQFGYDHDTLVREAQVLLNGFSGVKQADHDHFEAQIKVRWQGAFRALKAGRRSFSALKKSLRSMARAEAREKLGLAPAFVIGVREAGGLVLGSRGLKDSFKQSGLDHLFSLQAGLRRDGYIPKSVRFSKGTAFGLINEEIPGCVGFSDPTSAPRRCIIRSAAVPAKHVFLVHAASIAHQFDQKVLKRAMADGHDLTGAADLPLLPHLFWMALAFQRPNGRTMAQQRASTNDKFFGARTYLDYLAENGLGLEDAVDILTHGQDIFHNPDKKLVLTGTIKIAMRSAALMAALELMMRRHLRKRIDALQHTSEFGLIEGYLN